jgi:undecaprenyl-diphosphatase
MFDYLESIDRSIVLAVNGWNTPFLDQFFWYVTQTATWIPFYLLVLYFIWRKHGVKTTLVFLGMALLMIAIVDSSTTFLFKDTIMRYRPSRNLLLEKHLHYYMEDGHAYLGGKYGFFSSHAANNAAIALLAWFFLRKFYPNLKWILIFCVALIGLSRIYLTMHYLSDVLCGIVWGIAWAFVFWMGYKRLIANKLESK